MTDYGHDLIFGTFLTPQNQRPQEVVELARLTERAGLVTFMDHPHHLGFLDTWTLLSYVAAQTSGRICPDTRLTSRPPAVLAQAAASLDLLSGGRFELGIGPGDAYTAEANAAMGAPLRAPAGRRESRRQNSGGAWMTNVESELAPGNRIVDEAATAAGRDPRDIRRIFDDHGSFGPARRGFLQGSPQQWVEELLPLVIEQGASVFILVGDAPRAIERWGGEVAPALREAVERERRVSEVVRPSP